MIEACKYVKTDAPYEGTNYHGHFTDAEVRELGVPLVTGDIPGFVVMIGPAPSTEEAVETIKGYQSRGISRVPDRRHLLSRPSRRACPWASPSVSSLSAKRSGRWPCHLPRRACGHDLRRDPRAMWRASHKYTFDRINAFVNAYKPVNDITVSRRGRDRWASRSSRTTTTTCWAVPKSLIIYDDTKDWIDTSIEARGIKLKITTIDIPVSFASAFEGEIIPGVTCRSKFDGSRKDCFELVTTKDASEVEDHKIVVDGS